MGAETHHQMRIWQSTRHRHTRLLAGLRKNAKKVEQEKAAEEEKAMREEKHTGTTDGTPVGQPVGSEVRPSLRSAKAFPSQHAAHCASCV